ncbi:MAG TPA: glutamate 5-kinase [Oceanithermus sp.]|nr:glutamate 5-kinase [Oceanithermus sp.]
MGRDLAAAKRVVVKVGSAVLAGEAGLARERFEAVARGVLALERAGKRVVLVSSGAIAAGRALLGRPRPKSLPELQALAAAGQPELMRAWKEAFAPRPVAQVLLGAGDLADRGRFLNAKNTLETLLGWGVLPVVNENDTVMTEEIQFGDNDQLAVLVAGLVEAEALLLLSDVDALYEKDPREDPGARPVRELSEVTPEVLAMASPRPGRAGRGGMRSKLFAAKRALDAGVTLWLLPGRDPGAIEKALAGEAIGTRFVPRGRRYGGKKRWLAQVPVLEGELVVDAGAARALRERGASLLPVGVREVRGNFPAGAPVKVVDEEGRLVGYGITELGSETIARVKGLRSGEVARLLGRSAPEEVIHRDRFILLEEPT